MEREGASGETVEETVGFLEFLEFLKN